MISPPPPIRTRTGEACSLMSAISKQLRYISNVTYTHNICVVLECSNTMVGAGMCLDHLVGDLGELVDDHELAVQFKNAESARQVIADKVLEACRLGLGS